MSDNFELQFHEDGSRSLVPTNSGSQPSASDGITTIAEVSAFQFPAGTLSNPSDGVGAIGLILSRIGPFAIAFDTPDIDSQAGLVELPSGVTVIRAWAAVTSLWVEPPTLDIGAGGAGALTSGDWWSVTTYGAISGPQEDSGASSEANTPTDQSIVTLKNDGWLIARIGGSPTQGGADVYAIIATPSA